jgi:hypothetical protein
LILPSTEGTCWTVSQFVCLFLKGAIRMRKNFVRKIRVAEGVETVH